MPKFSKEPADVYKFLRRYLLWLPIQQRKERIKAFSNHEVKKSLESMTKNVQDRFWINEFCRGRNESIWYLFDRYTIRLTVTAYRIVKCEHLATDIVAMVIEKLLRMPIKRRKEVFCRGKIICIQPYLEMLVRNMAVDWWRKAHLIDLPGDFGADLMDEVLAENLTEYQWQQLKWVKGLVAILPALEQAVFAYWEKGIPNETIQHEMGLVESVHQIKQRIKRYIEHYERAQEDVYSFLLDAACFKTHKVPDNAILEQAGKDLTPTEFKYLLQYREEHYTGKTTPLNSLDDIQKTNTVKRRLKKLIINGNFRNS